MRVASQEDGGTVVMPVESSVPSGKFPVRSVPVTDGRPTESLRVAPADDVPPTEPSIDDTTRYALLAGTGDAGAQAAFVRATQAEVWRFVAALVDPASADDLTQDTYLRAFRALPHFAGRSTARTWLLGIARRTCADHLRAVQRRRRLEARLARQRPETDLPDDTALLAITELLRRIPADRRSAFVLTQVVGLSYAEAAAIEDVPIGTIRSRVARARVTLVEALSAAMVR
jgi:RNA polymerase sigma-70 factor (ECF subfamily)